MDMSELERSAEFVRLLTEHQSQLYAYIFMILPDAAAANDVLQDTNMVLWQKSGEFVPGTAFGAWASRVAYFKVLAYRKRRGQDHHIFDTDLLERLAGRAVAVTEDTGRKRVALQGCVKRLSRSNRELIAQRYMPGGSVQKIARRRGKTVGAVSQILYRIRLLLFNCIEQTLSGEAQP